MKILVVATWYPHARNPAEAPFNAEHVQAIRGQGHEVRVLHIRLGTALPLPEPANGLWQGIPVQRLIANPARPGTLLACQRVIGRELDWADVVHTMAFSSILVLMPAWVSRKIVGEGIPWVHTEHWNGVVNPASVSPLWEKISGLRHVLRVPHVVTGVTQQLAQEMQRFARADAAIVLPCVVKSDAELQEARFGTPLRLIAVGGLVPRKRPLVAIETIAWLRDNGVDAHLIWVGDGPLHQKCEELIATLHLSAQISLAGAVPPAEVSRYLADADLFFLPTEQENFFTSAAEALAAGRAVVSTRVGGFSDYVDDTNSRLVTEVSPESLGTAILEASATFRSVSAQSLATPIRARFAPSAIGALIDGAYASALARA